MATSGQNYWIKLMTVNLYSNLLAGKLPMKKI